MRNTTGRAKVITPRLQARRLSVELAAPVLGVSVYMVRSLVRQRRLPYYRVGRRIVLDRDDLEQFLQAHRVETRARPSDPPRGTSTTRPTSTGTMSPRPPQAEVPTFKQEADR
jgi:excisionase family DNA binding protein